MRKPSAGGRDRGMVLVSSLLMLVVITLLAVGLFRSFGLDEKIAGNTREKQRATQAAISAEQFAEWWLLNGQATGVTNCTGSINGSVTAGQICSNVLATSATGGVTAVPWQVGGSTVQVNYQPTGMTVNSTSPGQFGYYSSPAFYISYLGIGVGTNGIAGNVYQIDAVGYGATPSTASVVESTFIVQTTNTSDKSGP